MKRSVGRTFLVLLCVCAIGGLASAVARAQEADEPAPLETRHGNRISVFGDDIVIPAGVRQWGTVVCVGCDVTVEGQVEDDVVVVMGSLNLSGDAGNAVVGVMASQTIKDARIGDAFVNVLGSAEMERTRISGDLVNVLGSLKRDDRSPVSGEVVNIGFGSWFPSLWSLLLWARLTLKLLIFVLLLFVVAVVPDRIRRIAEAAPTRYAEAFFVGLLAYVGLWVLLAILSATVVGIPVLWFGFQALKWMGIAGIFFAVGRRIGHVFGGEISLLGGILLCFGLYVLITLAPTPLGILGLVASTLIWTIFFLACEAPAVGLVILTRLGAPPRQPVVVATPVAPAGQVGVPRVPAATPEQPGGRSDTPTGPEPHS